MPDPITRRRFLERSIEIGAAGLVSQHVLAASEPQGPATRAGWTIGCYTRPWAEHEYRVALDGIAEAGYRYVGLMTAKVEAGQ